MAPRNSPAAMRCPTCGYYMPSGWSTCKRCDPSSSVGAGAPDPLAYSAPARWAPAGETVPVKITTAAPDDWWRHPTASLLTTAAGFVLVLAAAFALPWMHLGGGLVHVDLSYKQMQDLLSGRDFFTRLALDLGPLILLADLLLVGYSLAMRGWIGVEAAAAPIGLACLVLYVGWQIHGFAGNVNNDALATALGLHARTGWGPWVCLLGCACLAFGAFSGPRSAARPTQSTTVHTFGY